MNRNFILMALSMTFIGLTSNGQVDKAKDAEAALQTSKNDYVEGWNQGGSFNLGIAQGHLENWAAGGEVNSLAINGVLNGFKSKKTGNKMWENTYYASYGLNYLASNSFVPLKTDDRFDFSSRYLKQMRNPKWYWGLLGRVQSQFSKGFNYADSSWQSDKWKAQPISQFFSPGYITLAIGFEYKPSKNFSWFLSPATSKMTFVRSKYTQNGSSFGVDKGKTFRYELGAYSSLMWMAHITENIDYRTRLDLYMNYLDKKGFGNVDILWDNVIAMKVNKYIGMTFGFTIMYDNDIPGQKSYNESTGKYESNKWGWTQLKQILNVGFAYQF